MKIDMIKELLSGGESITVEFKQSKNKLNKDVFESVCAFLNRNGGNLFLGGILIFGNEELIHAVYFKASE